MRKRWASLLLGLAVAQPGLVGCGSIEGLLGKGGQDGGGGDPYDAAPGPRVPRAQAAPADLATPAPKAAPLPALHVDGTDLKTDGGEVVALHGFNYFGFNTGTGAPDGLWQAGDPVAGDLARTVHRQKLLGFNAVRLPFSFAEFPKAPRDFHHPCQDVTTAELAAITLDPEVKADGITPPELAAPPKREAGHCNGYLPGNTTRERYLWAVKFLVSNGLYVLADNHFREDKTAEIDANAWAGAWAELAHDLHGDPQLVGRVFFDLLNEPGQYGQAWGKTDKAGVEALYLLAMDAIEHEAPEAVFFIEGTGQDGLNANWGDGYCTDDGLIRQHGLSDPRPFFNTLATKPYHNRVVLAPHVYGPKVTFAKADFSGPGLVQRLTRSFGHLTQEGFATGQTKLLFPVAIGEFGSHFNDPGDVAFMTDFGHYLRAEGGADDKAHKAIGSWFYWSWNANSADTGGLVTDNWRDIQWQKIRYLEGLGLRPWYRGDHKPTDSASTPPPAPAPAAPPPASAAPAPSAPPTQPASSSKAEPQPTASASQTKTSSPAASPSSGAPEPKSHPIDVGTPPADLPPIKTAAGPERAPLVSPPVSPRDGQLHAKVSVNHWEEGGKHHWAANLHLVNGAPEPVGVPYTVTFSGPAFLEVTKAWGVDDLAVKDGHVEGTVKEGWAALPPSGRGTTNIGFVYVTQDGSEPDWQVQVNGKPAQVKKV